jgi:hypothetical protein
VWNLDKLVNNLSHVVDAFADEGSFERMLENLNQTNKLDVRKLVTHLDNRITVVSQVVEPIDASSEKLIVAMGVKGDLDYVGQQVRNYFGAALKVDKIGEIEVYSEAEIVEEGDDDPFEDPYIEEDPEPAEHAKIVPTTYVAVHHKAILIANDFEFLKRVVSQQPNELEKSDDFIRVRQALDKLVDPTKVSLRHFGRLDHVVRANYELARRNELAAAQTVLARLLAKARDEAIKKGKDPQQFDGGKMPPFETEVAPYLGPNGWVIESQDDGWRITSCLLTKQPAADVEVADKSAEPSDEKKQ